MGIWKPTYQPELYHHGVKGMRWGQHKFGKDVFKAGSGGGGGGGLLEDEPEAPDDQEWLNALDAYGKGLITADQMLSVQAKREKAYEDYYDALKRYESSPSYAIKHPIETAGKLKDKFEDAVGLTDRHDTKAMKYRYESKRKVNENWNATKKAKAAYEAQRAKYYKTPLGKVAKYADAGKEAISAFKNYTRSN